ncbi:MAG: cytochrome c [Betaproteobacteria bacterium]|nr:cytochrome c [Betaproteobacteria bacterium]
MIRRLAALGLVLLPGAVVAEPPGERRDELINLVRQDCGSCHGLTMKGGLGPPLLPAALADKDPESLRLVVLNGRRGTPMPPWRDFFTEAEAGWVIELLREGLPDERR